MRTLLTGLLALPIIGGVSPSNAETRWLLVDESGFVTARTGAKDGLAVGCKAGTLSFTYAIDKVDLPPALADAQAPTLVVTTAVGARVAGAATRRDAAVWWRYEVGGSEAVRMALALYGTTRAQIAIETSDQALLLADLDVTTGRAQLAAAFNACRLQGAVL